MNKKALFPAVTGAVIFAAFFILLAVSFRYGTGSQETVVSYDSADFTAGQSTENRTLPTQFTDLSPRTEVTQSFDITPKADDYLYIKSVYAPVSVYADEEKIYEYGTPGTFPGFMADPPTNVALISFPKTGRSVHLRIVYLSPADRSSLAVYPVLTGSESAIFLTLSKTYGFSFIFSILLLLTGFLLFLTSVVILVSTHENTIFVWLSFFVFSVGLWSFGECNLTGLIIQNPLLLYLLDFTGLYVLPVPLIRFCMDAVDYRKPKLLGCLSHFMGAAAAAGILLQLTGAVSFEKSIYFFQILEPLSLCLLAAAVLYERLADHSVSAGRLLIAIAPMAFFSLMEFINYRVHITYIYSFFFQIGVLLFILTAGVITGIFVRDNTRIRIHQHQLEYEMKLAEYNLEEQKKRQKMLLENQEITREQRHDLRHQLTVIKSLCTPSDNTKLTEYLNRLIADIPTDKSRTFCENEAVNAIVSHYASIAESEGISLLVRLSVPENVGLISDGNLCVIFGNLMENAVEACSRMEGGERFIRLRSRLQYGIFTIAMDNSFNGIVRTEHGKFLSSKRPEQGIGLQSVSTLAKKYGGRTEFRADGKTFLSSVYFNTGASSPKKEA